MSKVTSIGLIAVIVFIGAAIVPSKADVGWWDPKTKKWVKDNVHSPCIDAGDPKADFSREPAPNGGRVNIGAYGNTKEASKSMVLQSRQKG